MQIKWEGLTLNHSNFPEYIGVTLDRSITHLPKALWKYKIYSEHQEQPAEEIGPLTIGRRPYNS